MLCILLVVELGRVHSDDNDKLALVPFLHPVKVRQCVYAVDVAVGPKVKDHDVPLRSSSETGLSVLSQVKPFGKSFAFELRRAGVRNTNDLSARWDLKH